jgi:hypothetical protein
MSTFVVPADDAYVDEALVVVAAAPAMVVVPAEGEHMRSAVSTTVLQKDPSDDRVFTIDWQGPHPGPFLAADETLVTAEVTVEDGLVKGDVDHDDTTVTVGLSGGTAEEIYRVTCTVTTSTGSTVERSFKVWVLDL